jgi:transcriptional regulator with XRE-family HTH domain
MATNKGRRAVAPGPTAGTVAANVARLRKRAGLTLTDLSERMAAVGRPMLTTGLSKIENGQRSVDVDDLVALALALEVNPNALLLPPEPTVADAALTDTTSAPWAWGTRESDSRRPLLSALARWHETTRPHKDADEIATEVAAARRLLIERHSEEDGDGQR